MTNTVLSQLFFLCSSCNHYCTFYGVSGITVPQIDIIPLTGYLYLISSIMRCYLNTTLAGKGLPYPGSHFNHGQC